MNRNEKYIKEKLRKIAELLQKLNDEIHKISRMLSLHIFFMVEKWVAVLVQLSPAFFC